MATYQIVPGRSTVSIEASSSVHPIHGEASGLVGTIEADIVDGQVQLASPPVMRLELPVDVLKSGNPLYDKELQRRIESRRYPKISGSAKSISPEDGKGRYHVTGDLTFHGVTRSVEGDIEVEPSGGDALKLSGEQTFDIRQFGIEPPKILMLRVYPDVKVRVNIVAECRD
ncbi:MAG TPA: YceI family protein [Mycobacteriales bacterium]|nr:YceI family protein [Mycobacteriales bacterium]